MNELIYGYDPASQLYIVGERTEWGTIGMPIASFPTAHKAQAFIAQTNLLCSDTRLVKNHAYIIRKED